ncbi:MAG: trypsin-like peptidase domain-containing protein [Clostridia bacterium]|nr:trypsin-like peptidase domain-containing protein [Clostridia bacterium]
MKRTKKICTFLLVLTLIVTSLFCFGGCFDKNKDGLDGRDFDLFSAYTQLVERGEFSGTYAEFVAQYLNVEVEWSENAALTTAINSSLAGSVSLKVVVEYTTSTGGIFGNQGTKKTMARYGSGVIIDLNKEQGDAYILTNCHVIYDGAFVEDGVTYTPTSTPTQYYAYLYGMGYEMYNDEYAIPLKVVGYSIENDIAVLKIDNSQILKNSLAQEAVFGNSDDILVGEQTYLVGNALGEGIAVTMGVVSVEREWVNVYAADGKTKLSLQSIRTDAAANYGNSGGGMYNQKGELIGLLFAGYAEDGAQGINHVLPGNTVRGIAQSIIDHCSGNTVATKKVRLGVTVAMQSVRQVFNSQTGKLGIEEVNVVKEVASGTPAYNLFQVGDVLVSATHNGKTVKIQRQWQLSDLLWQVRSGDTVTFTVERGGAQVSLPVTFSSNDLVAVS